MSSEKNKTKSDFLFKELEEAISRLKKQSKDKYENNKNGVEDEYEVAYLRGYYFGQLASLEDCFNLFNTFLLKSSNENQAGNVALKQQITVTVKIIDDLIHKIQNNEPTKEYLELIDKTISLIKESYKNI